MKRRLTTRSDVDVSEAINGADNQSEADTAEDTIAM
jgi:hypothetical protein